MSILTKTQLEALNVSSFPNNTAGAITPQILRDFNTSVIDTLVDSLDTGSFVTTSSFNSYTASQSTASLVTSITNLNTATASLFTSASLSLTTASVSGQTMTFTKGNGSTFNVTLPAGSGSVINTGSFATTGSNTFTGNQIISAAVFIDNNSLSIFGQNPGITLAANAQGSGSQYPGVGVNVDSALYQGPGVYGALGVYDAGQSPTKTIMALAANSYTRFAPEMVGGLFGGGLNAAGDDSAIVLRTGSATMYVEKPTIFKYNANIEGSLTASLQTGYVWAGGAGNVSTLVATSSFGGGATGATLGANTFTGSQTISNANLTISNTGSAFLSINGGTDNNILFNSPGTAFTSYGTFNFTNNNSAGGSGSLQFTVASASANFYTRDGFIFGRAETAPVGNGFVRMNTISGSLVLAPSGFNATAADLLHLSSSSNTNNINLIFKNNNNTADTILSGSGNMFINPAAPTAGFKRYIGGSGNIMLNVLNVPQITGSMAFSPTINNNYFGANGGAMNIRGPVSASSYTISGNSLVGGINIGQSATLHAQGMVSSLTITGNQVAGTLNIVANQSAITSSTSIVNNSIGGTVTLNLSSSAVNMNNNIINDSGFTFINQYYTGSLGQGAVFLNRNNIGGQSNQFIVSGSNTAGIPTVSLSDNFIFGGANTIYIDVANARVSGTDVYSAALRNGLLGNNLIVSGTSYFANTDSFGSVFLGRFNANDSIRNKTSDIIFAIGTGNSTTRKTGFLIDSGSNTFIEGTLNVSGSTTITGSLILSSSNAVELQVIGNSVFTGSVNGNVVSMSITSNTASMDLNLGNYFTLTLADTATTHISASNVQPGVSATLVITTGTNSSASLAPTMLQPSGNAYSATNGSSKKDVLSIVAVASGVPFVVSTKNMI